MVAQNNLVSPAGDDSDAVLPSAVELGPGWAHTSLSLSTVHSSTRTLGTPAIDYHIATQAVAPPVGFVVPGSLAAQGVAPPLHVVVVGAGGAPSALALDHVVALPAAAQFA